MTDRHAGYVVTLAHDVREDDAEAVLTALRMVRGVIDVQPVIADIGQQIGQMRTTTAIRAKLVRLLNELDQP